MLKYIANIMTIRTQGKVFSFLDHLSCLGETGLDLIMKILICPVSLFYALFTFSICTLVHPHSLSYLHCFVFLFSFLKQASPPLPPNINPKERILIK